MRYKATSIRWLTLDGVVHDYWQRDLPNFVVYDLDKFKTSYTLCNVGVLLAEGGVGVPGTLTRRRTTCMACLVRRT